MVIVPHDITATDAIATTIDATTDARPGDITVSTAIVTMDATTGDNFSQYVSCELGYYPVRLPGSDELNVIGWALASMRWFEH